MEKRDGLKKASRFSGIERSASDTGESSLALAAGARREVSGRQEAHEGIVSQSSCGAPFNTAQDRTG